MYCKSFYKDWKPKNTIGQDDLNELGLSPWFVNLLNKIASFLL